MNEIKINDWCYDRFAKEYVKVTNMRCPLCAKGDTLHQIKGVECAKEPCEAVAVRLLNFNDGKPSFGFTYRNVRTESLEKCPTVPFAPDMVLSAGHGNFKHFDFIGRV
jgi:hypothetical protein